MIALCIIGYLIMTGLTVKFLLFRMLDFDPETEDDNMMLALVGFLGLLWPFFVVMLCVGGPLFAVGWCAANLGRINWPKLSKWLYKR